MAWVNKFKVAFEGLLVGLRHLSITLQLVLGTIAVAILWYLQISYFEWLIVMVLIGLVIITEWANTVVEELVNFISPDYHLQAKKIKDLSAAMVLISCVLAVIIGCIIVAVNVGG